MINPRVAVAPFCKLTPSVPTANRWDLNTVSWSLVELSVSHTHGPVGDSLLLPPQPWVSDPSFGSLRRKEGGFAQRERETGPLSSAAGRWSVQHRGPAGPQGGGWSRRKTLRVTV